MNFYTSIFKKEQKPLKWILTISFSTFLLSSFIILFNYIIDPYNITGKNILNIKYKFARDDRTEKAYYFKTKKKVDNILLGSSRVYSINPKTLTDILGGTTYNFGVGTATVEDLLGILKYLQREKKLPKNLIIGVDFYTFNPLIPPNKYFIKNKELNFLSYSNYKEDYLSKLFSIDSFRGSYKTLKNHLLQTNQKPRFDKNGWAGMYRDYSKINSVMNLVQVKKEIMEHIPTLYSNLKYNHLDPKRIVYFEEIRSITKKNNISLFIFPTPLHPLLLQTFRANKNTAAALKEFIQYLSTFKNFTNLYNNKELNNNFKNFEGATHTTSNAGDLILKRIFNKN